VIGLSATRDMGLEGLRAHVADLESIGHDNFAPFGNPFNPEHHPLNKGNLRGLGRRDGYSWRSPLFGYRDDRPHHTL
jgi:hypothetical protein